MSVGDSCADMRGILCGVEGQSAGWGQLLPSLFDAKSCEISIGEGHGGGVLSHRCQLSSLSSADDISSCHTALGTTGPFSVTACGENGSNSEEKCRRLWRGVILLSLFDEGDVTGLHTKRGCGPPHGNGIGVSCSCESSFKCRATSPQLNSGVHRSVGIATGGAQSGEWCGSPFPGVCE